jgi:hypothetical protein
VIPIQKVNEAYDRLLKSDVKYRFSIDMASLKSEQSGKTCMTDFTEWNSFYTIVGSASAALIGLQFVALTLIASRPVPRGPETGAAYATPTIVHFGVALLLSAVVDVPWHGIGAISVVWGLIGFGGIVYAVIVTRRLRTHTIYRPVFEDWLFHCLLPFVAYAMLAVSAFVAHSQARAALFVVSAATLVFLFVGIHNAWDGVTYHIFIRKGENSESSSD